MSGLRVAFYWRYIVARPRIPFEESATFEIYEAYRAYVLETEPFEFPNPHAFWEKVLKPQLGYEMPWGSFQYHWQRLQIKKHPQTGQPYVLVNDKTKAVNLPEFDLIGKQELRTLRRLAEKVGLLNLP